VHDQREGGDDEEKEAQRGELEIGSHSI
jgi:hypothetical protein